MCRLAICAKFLRPSKSGWTESGHCRLSRGITPCLAGLLVQQIAPLNQPLPVITLSSELEHMLISMSRQSRWQLAFDSSLAERLIKSVAEASERSADGRQAIMVVSPQIRRQLSNVLRQHIDDLAAWLHRIAGQSQNQRCGHSQRC